MLLYGRLFRRLARGSADEFLASAPSRISLPPHAGTQLASAMQPRIGDFRSTRFSPGSLSHHFIEHRLDVFLDGAYISQLSRRGQADFRDARSGHA